MTSVSLIFFNLSKEAQLIKSVSDFYTQKKDYDVQHFTNVAELNQYVSQVENGLIIFKVENKRDIQDAVKFLKLQAKSIKKGLVRPACFLSVKSKKVEKILLKYGCNELLETNLKAKSFSFKIDFWAKNIRSTLKATEKSRARESKLQENSKTSKKTDKIDDFTFIEALNLQSDMWLIKHKNNCKKILGRYLFKVKGPSPKVGRWAELEGRSKKGLQIWKFIPKEDDEGQFILEDGSWYFEGMKPEFDWKQHFWNFSSEMPHLFFRTEQKQFFSKIKYTGKTITVAEDSRFAVAKTVLIDESCEGKYNFEDDEMFESHEENIEGNEQDFDDNLKGKGETDHLDMDPLKGKNQSEIDYEIEKKKKTSSYSEEDLGGNLEGKGSTDYIEDDPLEGKNRAEELDYDDLSGESSTDDLGAGHLRGKNSFDEMSIDDLEGKSSTDDLGEGHMGGKSSTDNLGEGHMGGESSTDDLGEGHMGGESSTDDLGVGHMGGESSTDDLGKGHLEGESQKLDLFHEEEDADSLGEDNQDLKKDPKRELLEKMGRPVQKKTEEKQKESRSEEGEEDLLEDQSLLEDELLDDFNKLKDKYDDEASVLDKEASRDDIRENNDDLFDSDEIESHENLKDPDSNNEVHKNSSSGSVASIKRKDIEKTKQKRDLLKENGLLDLDSESADSDLTEEEVDKLKTEAFSQLKEAGLCTDEDDIDEVLKDCQLIDREIGKSDTPRPDGPFKEITIGGEKKKAFAKDVEEELALEDEETDFNSSEFLNKVTQEPELKVSIHNRETDVYFISLLEDISSLDITVQVEKGHLELEKNYALSVQVDYMGAKIEITSDGKVIEVEPFENDKELITIEFDEEIDEKKFSSFVQLYQQRQEKIEIFMSLAKGYGT